MAKCINMLKTVMPNWETDWWRIIFVGNSNGVARYGFLGPKLKSFRPQSWWGIMLKLDDFFKGMLSSLGFQWANRLVSTG